jgi:hypothetical protein
MLSLPKTIQLIVKLLLSNKILMAIMANYLYLEIKITTEKLNFKLTNVLTFLQVDSPI